MATNPEYVRLADHLVHGLIVDTDGTGWSISGLDVKPFPDNREEARFVKRQLNAGKLEAAGVAEYEEAHPDGDEEAGDAEAFVEAVRAAAGRGAPRQEHKLRADLKGKQDRMRAARFAATLEREGVDLDEDDDLEAMIESERQARRREALLDSQTDEDDEDDDPAVQKERTATRPAAGAKKATKAKKAAKKRRAASEDDDES